MDYRRMGWTGPKLSAISIGAWVTFGAQIGERAAGDILQRAYDLGVNFFDNADAYADGQAEIVMGKAIRGLQREALVISSKVFWLVRRVVEDEVAPLAADLGLGLVTWSPLRSVLLSGKYLSGIPQGARLSLKGYTWLRELLTSLAHAGGAGADRGDPRQQARGRRLVWGWGTSRAPAGSMRGLSRRSTDPWHWDTPAASLGSTDLVPAGFLKIDLLGEPPADLLEQPDRPDRIHLDLADVNPGGNLHAQFQHDLRRKVQLIASEIDSAALSILPARDVGLPIGGVFEELSQDPSAPIQDAGTRGVDPVGGAARPERKQTRLAGRVEPGRVVNGLNGGVVARVAGDAHAAVDPGVGLPPNYSRVRREVGGHGDTCQNRVAQMHRPPHAAVARVIADEEVGAARYGAFAGDQDIDREVVEGDVGPDLIQCPGDEFAAVAVIALVENDFPPRQALECL